MMEWVLIFVSGLLGSAHCVGMCGGLAVAVGGGASDWRSALSRQAFYSAGRVSTYALLGAIAGAGGVWLGQRVGTIVNLQALLALVAGAVLIYEGLRAGGWLPRRARTPSTMPCLAGSLLAPLLAGRGPLGPLVAGMATALLPCGLLYAFLALASSAGNLARGAALMLCFALGTVPLMVLVGSLGPALLATPRGRAWRVAIFRAAAASVVLVGCVSLGRGLGFLSLPGRPTPPGCPACSAVESAQPAPDAKPSPAEEPALVGRLSRWGP